MPTKKVDQQQFDLRVVEREIAKGLLDRREYDSYMKALPDDEPFADYIEVYEEPPAEEPTPLAEEPRFTSA
ncbi:MAG TPA: hypothetical protein PLZ86_03645 [bacterium]|nr:hypothetical protein [bacterium]